MDEGAGVVSRTTHGWAGRARSFFSPWPLWAYIAGLWVAMVVVWSGPLSHEPALTDRLGVNPVVLLGILFLCGFININLPFRETSAAANILDAAVLVAVIGNPPGVVALTVTIGASAALAIINFKPAQVVFNVANTALWTAMNLAVFRALVDPADIFSWHSLVAFFVACQASALVSSVLVLSAIRLSEGEVDRAKLAWSLALTLVESASGAALAVLTLVVLWHEPQVTPLLLVAVGVVTLAYRAYFHERRERANMEFLHAASGLVQETANLRAASPELVERAREMFHAETAELVLMHPDEGSSILATAVVGQPPLVATAPLDDARRELARSLEGGPATADPRRPGGTVLDRHLARLGRRRGVAVLLRGENEPLGYLLVAGRDRRWGRFREREVQLLSTLANQVASTLEYEAALDVNTTMNAFVNMIVHDLRSPLSVVAGYAEMLAEGSLGPLPDEAGDGVTVIAEKTEEVRALVEDLLLSARLAAGHIVADRLPLNLGTVAGDAVRRVSGRAALLGATVTVDVARPSPVIAGDAGHITRIIDNLLNNALNYSGERPHLVVEVSTEAGVGRLAVTDNGRGIPTEMHARIFERFVRVQEKTATQGTGLGLYISRELAERQGGTLELERSVPGAGSTFALRLPLAAAAEATHDVAPATSTGRVG